jgi:O-glycosyl hydrolase
MLAPLRQALEARGEKLHVNVNYTDFQWDATIVQGSLSHANDPAEFAEFVHASFVRLRDRYGIVPDAFEVILEPDNTADWRAANIGRGLIAATDRLRASGFTPEVIVPSNSTMSGAIAYFDQMMAVPGVASRVGSFAYHRYGTERSSDVATIRARAHAAGLKTAMLEKVDAGIDVLLEDLTVGNVSAWQQWAAASSTRTPDNGGYYARVDPSNPTKPVGMAKHSDQLAQVFRFVRRGAVRVEASSDGGDGKSVAFVNADGSYVVVVRTHGSVGEFGVVGLPAGRYAQRFVSDDGRTESMDPVEIPANGFVLANVKQAGVLAIYGVP